MLYAIKYSIEVIVDKITGGTLSCGAKYTSPVKENSLWYLEPYIWSMYATVSFGTILVPMLNVEVITNTLKLHRDVSTLSQSEVENKTFFNHWNILWHHKEWN